MDAPDRRDFLKLVGAGAALPWSGGAAGRAMADGMVDGTADAPASPALAGLARLFAAPPHDARPGIFWYWMNGNVTRIGITADLEAMHAAGIRTVMLFSIGGEGPDTLVSPPAQSLTPYWWDLIRFAVAEAERLGLEIALNACDGWATASGPWITPDLSMQHLVWSETGVDGDRAGDIRLAQPASVAGYYRDLKVFAWRRPRHWADDGAVPQISGSLAGADAVRLIDPANDRVIVDSDTGGDIVLAYPQPFTLRSVTVRTPPFPGPFPGVQRAANSLFVDASDDGIAWWPVGRLDYPRHGWETPLTTLTHALPPTRAQRFRFRHVAEHAEAHREDLYHAGDGRLRLIGLTLSGRPRVPLLPVRTGEVWGAAPRLTERQLPAADCLSADDLIDLSDRLDADGRLAWTPPAGQWIVLRIGHGSTGRANSIAGGGKGLECDKLSRAAARVQFDGWFGKALETVGPDLAGKVLHIFHVDSWEAQSQNWTPAFAAEFLRRRGYDLMPHLAIMAGVPIGSADHVERILFDVRRTIADLVQDNFFGEMATLAHAHGCIFSGETVNPTMVADGLDYGRAVDVPMGEFWLRSPQNEKPHDIADAVSAAHIHGRPIAGAEAFTEWNLKWDETPWMLKARGDHHFAQGINRFYLHVYAHQPWLDRAPGVTLQGVGTFFGRTQTWWRPGKAWIDYLARSQALLQAGAPVIDVAAFIGEDMPARSVLAGGLPAPLPRGYRHDSINRHALLNLARVEGGALVLPGARYRVLILPDTEWMTPELTEKLASFAQQGLAIIGVLPTASPGGGDAPAADRRVCAAAARMRLHGYDALAALLERICPPDVVLAGDTAAIEWTHRAEQGWHLYYFSNQDDRPATVDVDLRASGRPHLWRPDSGAREPMVAWRNASGRTQLTLALAPREAVFVMIDTRGSGDPVITGAQAATLVATPTGAVLRSATAGDWTLQRRSGRTIRRTIAASPPVLPLGGWRIAFPGVSERPWPDLLRWDRSDDPAIRFFSGTAHYATVFRVPVRHGVRWLLDLGAVADLAKISVNGRDMGVLWKPPFVIDVTDAVRRGENRLVVAITNTWANRLIGDAGRAERSSFVTPALHFGKPWQPRADDPLLPAGLIGPVMLRGLAEVDIT